MYNTVIQLNKILTFFMKASKLRIVLRKLNTYKKL